MFQAGEKQVIEAVQRITEQSDLHCEPHDINVHRLGNELSVSFHCLQAADTPIIDAHDVTEKIERELREQVPEPPPGGDPPGAGGSAQPSQSPAAPKL